MAKKEPFNISILSPDKRSLQGYPEIKVLDIMDGATDNLHPEGLFSVEYFGRKGEDRRMNQFAYIDLKTEILHPVLYDAFSRLKELYKGIMDGTDYAVWDEKEKDFFRANEIEGKTGYSFFIEKMGEIDLKDTGSSERATRIKLVKENLDKALTRYLLVLPAGMRDIDEDQTGRVQSDEINKKYMRVLGISNLLYGHAVDASHDSTRKTLQHTFNDIYQYLRDTLEGKRGELLGKYASRSLEDGTRNVITSKNTVRENLYADNNAGVNDTGIGLYQTLKGLRPIVRYRVRRFMESRFTTQDGSVKAVNPDTLKSEYISLDPDEVDLWTTGEGIDKIVSRFKEDGVRHRSVMLGAHYAFLVYQDDKHFKVFDNIDDLPETFSRENVRPISMAELLYLSYFNGWNKYRAWITRYPVTGSGSVYPSRVYIHTTNKALRLQELGMDWEPTGEIALEYPLHGEGFMNSLVPDSTHLDALGAD